jgi:mono/diheme cytochrome c family protein
MRKLLKAVGIVVGALVLLLLIGLGVVYAVSEQHIGRSYAINVAPLAIPADSASVAEGGRLYLVRGCASCHMPNGSGRILTKNALVGTIAASNLTGGQGGVAGDYQDADWVRAIVHGVGSDGKALAIMPSDAYFQLSDGEVADIIAYVKSLKPVDNELPDTQLGLLTRLAAVTGQGIFPAESIDHSAARLANVTPNVSVEYGQYLAATCAICHGQDFSGRPGEQPPAQNITPDTTTGIGKWTADDFVQALRSGKRPDGTTIDPVMKDFSQLNDTELSALYLYLKSIPAVQKASK